MKRFTILSAICLGLVAFTPACGGGGDANSADSAEGSPVDQLKKVSNDLQAEVDGLLKPIDDLDAAIDAVVKLPADLKASAKVSIDGKKLAAVDKSLVETGTLDTAALGIEGNAEAKAKVDEAFGKLKACIDGIKAIPEKTKAVGAKLAEAIVKVPTLGAKATASLQVSISSPFSKPEVKAQAEADLKEVKAIVDGFSAKANEWMAKVKDVPAKAPKALDKLKGAFAG